MLGTVIVLNRCSFVEPCGAHTLLGPLAPNPEIKKKYNKRLLDKISHGDMVVNFLTHNYVLMSMWVLGIYTLVEFQDTTRPVAKRLHSPAVLL